MYVHTHFPKYNENCKKGIVLVPTVPTAVPYTYKFNKHLPIYG